MPEEPAPDAPPALRPSRITGPIRRKLAPPPPKPPPERVPGFEQPLTEIVDAWTELLAEVRQLDGLHAFEIETSVIAGTLQLLDTALASPDRGEDDLIGPVVGEFARRRTPEALIVLETLGRIAEGRLRDQAGDAAGTLRASGVNPPDWSAELDEPCELMECGELRILRDSDRLLLLSFRRAGQWHGFAVVADDKECGEINSIIALDPNAVDLGRGFAQVGKELLVTRTRSSYTPLDPEEARWRIETALARRTDHDAELTPMELLSALESHEEDEEDEPGQTFPQLLPLLKARLELLPRPNRPLPPHDEPERSSLSEIQLILRDAQGRPTIGGVPIEELDGFWATDDAGFGFGGGRRVKPQSALPKKRTKKDGPAPVYRLRIDLRGAKPPLWRRLEVNADITLGTMHELIQTLFDWQDYHLHLFETEYGRYGTGDADLGHRDPASVTLEQILREEGEKLEYAYDFGDGWELMIKLEKVLPPEPGLVPRCTAGRREAPPEDSGGIWAYEQDGPFGIDVFDRDELNETLRRRFGNS